MGRGRAFPPPPQGAVPINNSLLVVVFKNNNRGKKKKKLAELLSPLGLGRHCAERRLLFYLVLPAAWGKKRGENNTRDTGVIPGRDTGVKPGMGEGGRGIGHG